MKVSVNPDNTAGVAGIIARLDRLMSEHGGTLPDCVVCVVVGELAGSRLVRATLRGTLSLNNNQAEPDRVSYHLDATPAADIAFDTSVVDFVTFTAGDPVFIQLGIIEQED